ncbi:HalOD1 output domain-containing protein [Halomicroarcula sp. GCM10025817]|uniref:HalOD1 output domain-containing protein n=1 Tax=Haloarcula TaxID=2237 RepID=UPI0023E8E1F2|nr:HalOD1 output domain-containing protein [Halomicroarcula sp. SYNS111]
MTTSSGGEDGFHVGGEERPSDVVLRNVASQKGCDVLELAPLQDAVDVKALNQLFESPGVERLEFVYEEFEVTVEPGRVHLRELQ